MSERYLRHVTLSTGHSRDSYRNEVPDDVVAVCRQLIDQAITGEEDGSMACMYDLPGTPVPAHRFSER
jgi:hypothetical protein